MRQRKLTRQEQEDAKAKYPGNAHSSPATHGPSRLTLIEIYRHRLTTFAGFPFDFSKTKTMEHTPEEREAFFQDLWDKVRGHFGP